MEGGVSEWREGSVSGGRVSEWREGSVSGGSSQ